MQLVKYSKSLLGMTLLSGILMTSSVYAGQGGHHGYQDKGRMHKMAKLLVLTDEQKAQIKDIFEKAKADKHATYQSLKDYRAALKSLVNSDDYSADAVRALYLQYQETFIAKEINQTQIEHQVNAVLTEEQLAKKEKLAEKFKHKKRAHHKHKRAE